MARKDEFSEIGGLDERFGVGMFEDDDLAVRYKEKGMRVVCAEDVFIHHFQGASFKKLEDDHYKKIFNENRSKYEEKWGRKWEPYKLRKNFYQSASLLVNGKIQHSSDKITFRCNICGKSCETYMSDLDREKPSCSCGSTVRSRSIVHLLSTELFGKSIALPDFPERPDISGWGMSDAGYSDLLPQKLNYVNTFYHKSPYLDIIAPVDDDKKGILDFLISTEVFEHITPPVSRGFVNARQLLKPSGFFLFTVPFTLEPQTLEHFPELHQFKLKSDENQHFFLENETKDGRKQIFNNLVFHGGPGETLEMRIFSKKGLLSELEMAGFDNINIFSEPYMEFGIYYRDNWSLPLIARSNMEI
jgi:hypothetical protein